MASVFENYEQINSLIESADFVDFAPFGDGVREELIRRAEDNLGVAFPASYRWWLKNYGGGEIFGQEIFSVYESGLRSDFSGGDICHMHMINASKGRDDDGRRLFISQASGAEQVFYFKLAGHDEWPVYSSDPGLQSERFYAESFGEFLIKRIEELWD